MKITHVIDYFQPQVGYQETFLAKVMQDSGHKVSVVTSNYYYPFSQYQARFFRLLGKRTLKPGRKKEEGIDTLRLSSLEIPNTPLIFMKRFKETLIKERPDILYCHGMHSPTSYLCAKYKDKYPCKLIYDSHAASFNTDLRSTLPKRIYWLLFKKFFKNKIIKNANLIIAIGEDEQKLLSQSHEIDIKAIKIFRLGAEIQRFKPDPYAGKALRKKLMIGLQDFVLIYAGKVSPGKGIELLIEAFLKSNVKGMAKLLILGASFTDDYSGQLMQRYNNPRILFHDFVENKNLAGFFNASDAGAWPENPTQTVPEAIASGLPLILPDIPNHRFLKTSKAVIFFKKGSGSSLTKAIENIFSDSKRLALMKKMARSYSEKNLSWNKISDRILKSLS